MAGIKVLGPQVGAPQSGPIQIAPVSVPADLHSGDIGEALNAFGVAGMTYFEKLKKAQETTRQNLATTDYLTRLDTAETTAVTDTDFTTAPAKFADTSAALEADALAAAKLTPEGAAAMQLTLRQHALSAKGRVDAAALGREGDANIASMAQQEQVFLNGIMSAASPVERAAKVSQLAAMYDENVKAGWINAAAAETRKENVLGAIDVGDVLKGIREHPEGILEMLNDSSAFPNLDPVKRQELITAAESGADAAVMEKHLFDAVGPNPEKVSLSFNRIMAPRDAHAIFMNGIVGIEGGTAPVAGGVAAGAPGEIDLSAPDGFRKELVTEGTPDGAGKKVVYLWKKNAPGDEHPDRWRLASKEEPKYKAAGGPISFVWATDPFGLGGGVVPPNHPTLALNPALTDRLAVAARAGGMATLKIAGARAGFALSGHSPTGEHPKHNAIDLDVRDLSIPERLAFLEELSRAGITGIGIGTNMIHADVGGRRSWGYVAGKSVSEVPAWARDFAAMHDAGKFGSGGRVGGMGVSLISPKGALGPSQILPGTARDMAKMLSRDPAMAAVAALSDDALKARLLADQPLNLTLGEAYWNVLLGHYDGNIALAAAGYNGGPERADRWQAAAIAKYGENFTPLQLAGIIEIPETRNYVLKLFGLMKSSPAGPGLSRRGAWSGYSKLGEVLRGNQARDDATAVSLASLYDATKGDDLIERAKGGFRVDPAEWANAYAINKAAAATGNVAATGKLHDMETVDRVAPAVEEGLAMPPAVLDTRIAALDEQARVMPLVAADQNRFDGWRAAQKIMGAEAGNNPVGLAERAGRVPAIAVDPRGNPDDPQFLATLTMRGRAAAEAQAVYGGGLKPFKPSEIGPWKERLDQAGESERLGLLSAMARQFGQKGFAAAAEQLGLDPVTATAAEISLDRPDVARTILRGAQLMKAPGVEKPVALLQQAAADALGGDLYPPGTGLTERAIAAAVAYEVGRRGGTGALFTPPDKNELRQAIEKITGEIVKVNGQKVPSPPGLSGGDFSATVEHLAEVPGGVFDRYGKPVPIETVRSYGVFKPLSLGGGSYVVGVADASSPDGFAAFHDKNGGALILDMKAAATGMASAPKTPPALDPFRRPPMFGLGLPSGLSAAPPRAGSLATAARQPVGLIRPGPFMPENPDAPFVLPARQHPVEAPEAVAHPPEVVAAIDAGEAAMLARPAGPRPDILGKGPAPQAPNADEVFAAANAATAKQYVQSIPVEDRVRIVHFWNTYSIPVLAMGGALAKVKSGSYPIDAETRARGAAWFRKQNYKDTLPALELARRLDIPMTTMATILMQLSEEAAAAK